MYYIHTGPEVIRGCAGSGEDGYPLVEHGDEIPAGCDVCVKQAEEFQLNLTCNTDIAMFQPDISVLSYTWTDQNFQIIGEESTVLVREPGYYTCTVDFGDGGRDAEFTVVECKFS